MTANLKGTIKQDMIAAMRAQQKARLGVIRMLQAAIKQKEVDERTSLSDNEVLAVIEKMIKQRKESITQYQQGGRPDLATKEAEEVAVLEAYMPAPLDTATLDALIAVAISESDATSVKDMGKVMNHLKSQIQGRANMAEVSAKVKQQLA